MGRPKLPRKSQYPVSILDKLDVCSYFEIVQFVVNDVTNCQDSTGLAFSVHEFLFARFAVLSVSVLGGFCWPGAYRSVCEQTFSDVAHVFESPPLESASLNTHRKEIEYGVTPHAIVGFAFHQLLIHLLGGGGVSPKRRQHLTSGSSLGPRMRAGMFEPHTTPLQYLVDLLTAYLEHVAEKLNVRPGPSLDTFVALGNYLVRFVYDLDVRATLVNEIHTGTVQTEMAFEAFLLKSSSAIG